MLEARAPSGETFVRINAASVCESGGLLHGGQPFLLRELLVNASENRKLAEKVALAKRHRETAKARAVSCYCSV